MGLETASFINALNSAWPLGTDSGTFGDNHLRLIKSVLKATFPGSGGNGFSKQITATEDEINFLHGVTSPIQDQLSAASFPSGTVIAFYNASAPPGWTIVNQPTTRMCIIGNSVGHTTGGSHSPTVMDKVPSHSHSLSDITISTAGDHDHAGVQGTPSIEWGYGDVTNQTTITFTSQRTGLGGGHTHAVSGGTISNNSSASNWTPSYIGLVLCSKN